MWCACIKAWSDYSEIFLLSSRQWWTVTAWQCDNGWNFDCDNLTNNGNCYVVEWWLAVQQEGRISDSAPLHITAFSTIMRYINLRSHSHSGLPAFNAAIIDHKTSIYLSRWNTISELATPCYDCVYIYTLEHARRRMQCHATDVHSPTVTYDQHKKEENTRLRNAGVVFASC